MPVTGEVVRVLEVDPDLAERLDPESGAAARELAVARVELLERGMWRGDEDYPAAAGYFGLLVVEGILSRTVGLAERSCVELLGPGDLLRPWLKVAAQSAVPLEASWYVVEPTRLAVLDRRFVQTMARFPDLFEALLDRVMIRSRWLAFHLAVCQLKRIESRLLVVMWHFAERWGRVAPEGIVVPLRLTHQLLAGVVGAQRPSVTTALGRLSRAGLLERRPDGSWLLRGEPPEELGAVVERAAGRGGPDGSTSAA